MSKYTYFTTFLDSRSCLQSLHSMNIDHPYILNILYNYYYVSNQGKIVALKFEIVKFKIHSTDINISQNSI